MDALDGRFAAVGRGGEAAAPFQNILKRGLFLDLVDGRDVHSARHSHQRTNRRDVNHVSRQQRHIFRFVAAQKQIVKIELGNDLVAAFELNAAHRTAGRGAARSENRVHQRAKRTDSVVARLLRLTDDEHLNRTKLAEVHVEIKILEDAPNLRFEERLQLLELQTGHRDVSDLGYLNAARSIYRRAQINVHLPPSANQNLVAGTDRVIGCDGNIFDRRKCVGDILKKVLTEDRQIQSRRLTQENLKIIPPLHQQPASERVCFGYKRRRTRTDLRQRTQVRRSHAWKCERWPII